MSPFLPLMKGRCIAGVITPVRKPTEAKKIFNFVPYTVSQTKAPLKQDNKLPYLEYIKNMKTLRQMELAY